MRHARSPRNRFETIGVALATALAACRGPGRCGEHRLGGRSRRRDDVPTATSATARSATGNSREGDGTTLSVVDYEGGNECPAGGEPRRRLCRRADAGRRAVPPFEPGADVHLLDEGAAGSTATAGSPGVRFVMKPAYTWIGNTTMSAGAWSDRHRHLRGAGRRGPRRPPGVPRHRCPDRPVHVPRRRIVITAPARLRLTRRSRPPTSRTAPTGPGRPAAAPPSR